MINKWYNTRNEKLTLENAKDFFFHFECNFNFMEYLVNDFQALNIPKETIVLWTTEYYEKDISVYDSLIFLKKITYMSRLSLLCNQFTDKFLFKVVRMLIELLENSEIYRLYQAPQNICNILFIHVKGTTVFKGFIPCLAMRGEKQMLGLLLKKFIDHLLTYGDVFDRTGPSDVKSFYQSLTIFNQHFRFDYQGLIDKIKPQPKFY